MSRHIACMREVALMWVCVHACAGASAGLPGLPSMLPMMDTSEVDHLLGLQRRLYGEVGPLPKPIQ